MDVSSSTQSYGTIGFDPWPYRKWPFIVDILWEMFHICLPEGMLYVRCGVCDGIDVCFLNDLGILCFSEALNGWFKKNLWKPPKDVQETNVASEIGKQNWKGSGHEFRGLAFYSCKLVFQCLSLQSKPQHIFWRRLWRPTPVLAMHPHWDTWWEPELACEMLMWKIAWNMVYWIFECQLGLAIITKWNV